jgi:hypothetical protein
MSEPSRKQYGRQWHRHAAQGRSTCDKHARQRKHQCTAVESVVGAGCPCRQPNLGLDEKGGRWQLRTAPVDAQGQSFFNKPLDFQQQRAYAFPMAHPGKSVSFNKLWTIMINLQKRKQDEKT